ncbi:hypothetical protein AB7942_18475 [Neobacillus sp. BF23-41]
MTSLILDNPKIGEEAYELIRENTNDAIFLLDRMELFYRQIQL